MTTPLACGVYAFPQAAPYDALRDLARHAEAVGFDSLWVADQTPMAFPGLIEFDAWSLLGALARDTSTIRLGTLVTHPVSRHPLITAMAATTVDHASGGRLTLGIGAGGTPADLQGVGQGGLSNAELVDRLGEQLDTIDRLLRGETVTRTEGFYPTKDAIVPRPVQDPRPPILVAAQGPKSMQLAARHADTWNTVDGQALVGEPVSQDQADAAIRRLLELLDKACTKVGRDPATVRRSVLSWRSGALESADSLTDWVGRHRELGFEEFIFFYSDDPEKNARLDQFVKDQRDRSIG